MSSGMRSLDTSFSAIGLSSRNGSCEVTSLLSRVNLILWASGLIVINSVVLGAEDPNPSDSKEDINVSDDDDDDDADDDDGGEKEEVRPMGFFWDLLGCDL